MVRLHMREEETLDERVYRIIGKSELTPNFKNPAIIPLIPFDGKGADRIINFILPSETNVRTYFETFHGSRSPDEESRYDLDSREYEDSTQFRDGDLSLEELMELDQYHLGYDPEELTIESSPRDSFDLRVAKGVQCDNSSDHQIIDDNDVISDGKKSQKDCEYPTSVTEVLKTVFSSDRNDFQPLGSARGEIGTMKNNSFDSEVSSVISASSTIISSPNILRLKARKRRLERFLSEKSLESQINRRVLT